MKISVFGMGYVGVVTAACLSHLGHSVLGVDIIEKKVELLQKGNSPIVEPGIDQLIKDAVKKGRLNATTDFRNALNYHDVIIVCVGTPALPNGDVDLTTVLKVASEIANLPWRDQNNPIFVFRSTMLPGTMENDVYPVFKKKFNKSNKIMPNLIYHPEFLREGSGINDFLDSPQTVVASVNGMDHESLKKLIARLYEGIEYELDIVQTKTAEMIKYFNNTFHALKISFANEIGRICRRCGISTHELFEIFLRDKKLNVSSAYLRPGFSFGGSCLPKELKALTRIARQYDIDIPVITNIDRSNEVHIDLAFRLILKSGCKKIGFLGLSFKPGTDDVRDSPFVRLVEKCLGKGLDIFIYDKSIDLNSLIGKNLAYLQAHISHITERMVDTLDEAIDLAEIIILCHPDTKYLDALSKRKQKRVLDLTGKLKKDDLSESRDSIITSKDGFTI